MWHRRPDRPHGGARSLVPLSTCFNGQYFFQWIKSAFTGAYPLLVWEITMPGGELWYCDCTFVPVCSVLGLCLVSIRSFRLVAREAPLERQLQLSVPKIGGNPWAQLVLPVLPMNRLDSIKLILREALVEKESLKMDPRNTGFSKKRPRLLLSYCFAMFCLFVLWDLPAACGHR